MTSECRRRLASLSAWLLTAGLGIGATSASSASCIGQRPSGASCNASSECETGLLCLYPIGSGCTARGSCTIPVNDCSGSSFGLALCGCGAAPIDLTCLPSSAALPQRTTTGPECRGDGGSDSGSAPD